MLENIYTGTELGAGGGGGGGSTNPTSGVMPVNQFGVFQDSNIQSDVPVGHGTKISINDLSENIQATCGSSTFVMNGAADTITIDGTHGVNLNGSVYINNHLGLAILRFLSNGAGNAAIKVSGNTLAVRNGNDSADNDLTARDAQFRDVTATGAAVVTGNVTGASFILDTKSKIQSAVDGILTFLNNAGTSFTRLCFGGNTSSFPALSRNGAGIDVVLADGSATADLKAKNITATGNVTTDGNVQFGISVPKSKITSAVDSTILLQNSAGTDFKFLQFGGNTATFPMLSKISSGIAIRKADDTGDFSLTALDVTASGKVVTSADFSVNAKSVLTSLADSNFTLYNAAKTAFSLLQFGGITNAFPAIKRNGTAINIRTADDVSDAALTAGAITSSGVVTSAQDFQASAKSILRSATDGNFTLLNAAGTGFTLLQIGGTTSSFPAIKRTTSTLECRLADDSNYTDIRANLVRSESAFVSTNVQMTFRTGGGTTVQMGLHTSFGLNINLAGAGNNNTSALLQLDSTTKGFLPPRMTNAQRTAIATPAVGLMVYCTDATEGLYIYKSTGWTFVI